MNRRRILDGLTTTTRSPILQVLKTSAAAVLSWLVAAWALSTPAPIFAAIAALLVVQPSVNQTLLKGVERSLGVIGGVVIAWIAGVAFGQSSWVILVVIVASLLIAWVLRLGPGSTNQIPISAMLVLALGTATPLYAVDRILETIIGAAIGLAVNLAIVPPVNVQPARAAVNGLLEHTVRVMDRLAEAVIVGPPAGQRAALLADARRLRPERERTEAVLAAGAESLNLNPRGGRYRRILERDRELLTLLTSVTTQVAAMARAVHDHAFTAEVGPVRRAIARELERAAHDLRLVGRRAERGAQLAPGAEPPAETASIPALTAPLAVVEPPKDWMLIGFLLEEIRRVREAIVAYEDGTEAP